MNYRIMVIYCESYDMIVSVCLTAGGAPTRAPISSSALPAHRSSPHPLLARHRERGGRSAAVAYSGCHSPHSAAVRPPWLSPASATSRGERDKIREKRGEIRSSVYDTWDPLVNRTSHFKKPQPIFHSCFAKSHRPLLFFQKP